MAKNPLLAVCHAFKIDRNAIQMAGVIRSEKYSAIRTTAAILWKYIFIFKDGSRFQFRIQNYSAFRTAEVFHMTKNPIRFSFS